MNMKVFQQMQWIDNREREVGTETPEHSHHALLSDAALHSVNVSLQ